MVSRDFRSVSKWEASNETFLAGRVGHPGIGAVGLSIFPLSLRPCERESRGSADNHTWMDAARTWETRRAYPRWTRVDSKSLCRAASTIEPRRASNFVCYRANFDPRTYRWFAREDQTDKIAALFLAEKNIATWIGWWKKRGKKKKKQNDNQRKNAQIQRKNPQI